MTGEREKAKSERENEAQELRDEDAAGRTENQSAACHSSTSRRRRHQGHCTGRSSQGGGHEAPRDVECGQLYSEKGLCPPRQKFKNWVQWQVLLRFNCCILHFNCLYYMQKIGVPKYLGFWGRVLVVFEGGTCSSRDPSNFSV